MALYSEMTREELEARFSEIKGAYDDICRKKYSLDMSRGKFGQTQLDLSGPMLNCLTDKDDLTSNGIDCRNYGGLDGIKEMKQIIADLMGVTCNEVIVGGNSSLAMMFDNIAVNMSHGVRDGKPWMLQGNVKFICPVPGYDRHYSICEYFHIEMITVDMLPDGPDMDAVERIVSSDPMVKGMWCVPIYSNPDGCVYSEETVKRIANLKPAANDFRLYWDNAYCIHNFRGDLATVPNIIAECEKAGNPNMPLMFMSFSKISFCGAAVAAIISSKSNCDYILKRIFIQTVGPDKLNQLRHVRFFKNADGVKAHMKKMADILRPKFELVDKTLSAELGGKGIADWNTPNGGYFISFNTLDGCAKRTVQLCKEAGLIMTAAGATYPYGHDPHDKNIRIAPSYPTIDELSVALSVFTIAVQYAAIEKLIKSKS